MFHCPELDVFGRSSVGLGDTARVALGVGSGALVDPADGRAVEFGIVGTSCIRSTPVVTAKKMTIEIIRSRQLPIQICPHGVFHLWV